MIKKIHFLFILSSLTLHARVFTGSVYYTNDIQKADVLIYETQKPQEKQRSDFIVYETKNIRDASSPKSRPQTNPHRCILYEIKSPKESRKSDAIIYKQKGPEGAHIILYKTARIQEAEIILFRTNNPREAGGSCPQLSRFNRRTNARDTSSDQTSDIR